VDSYIVVKTIHIISATILFGTGLGIAHFHLRSSLAKDPAARLFGAGLTVSADFFFTVPAVIVQPLSGAWLIWKGGFDWWDYWLVLTYGLYILAGLCWVPVVFIQIRMKQMLEIHAREGAFDRAAYDRLFSWWFGLGWPAFGGLVAVFFLMVSKPSW
jgi:uncharacterized membrane protein